MDPDQPFEDIDTHSLSRGPRTDADHWQFNQQSYAVQLLKAGQITLPIEIVILVFEEVGTTILIIQ